MRIQPQSYRKQEIEKHDSFGNIEAQNHTDCVEEKVEGKSLLSKTSASIWQYHS